MISIALIHLNEKAKNRKKVWLTILVALSTVLIGALLGLLLMVDFYHAGILTVLVFYFFRHKKWWCYPCQLLLLFYINTELIGGLGYNVDLFGHTFFILQQTFALLALIPIWLYRGKQGYHSKALKYLYYAFYPAHMLILAIIKLLG